MCCRSCSHEWFSFSLLIPQSAEKLLCSLSLFYYDKLHGLLFTCRQFIGLNLLPLLDLHITAFNMPQICFWYLLTEHFSLTLLCLPDCRFTCHYRCRALIKLNCNQGDVSTIDQSSDVQDSIETDTDVVRYIFEGWYNGTCSFFFVITWMHKSQIFLYLI